MLNVVDWGEIDYALAVQRQEAEVEDVAARQQAGVLVFCSHPPVVTLGRGSQDEAVAWTGNTIQTNRGGKATYHGPSQVVLYPILNLDHQSPPRDLHAYLRNLEKVTSQTLQSFGIVTTEPPMMSGADAASMTGVWVGDRKVASIGIAVRKWITYHGVAINLFYDANAFQGIRPCGFTRETMVSVEELLGRRIERGTFQDRLQSFALTIFE